jgi:hypothetical protein
MTLVVNVNEDEFLALSKGTEIVFVRRESKGMGSYISCEG